MTRWNVRLFLAVATLGCRGGGGPEMANEDARHTEAASDGTQEVQPAEPPARDLVPYARLWARDTRPSRGLWPHEAWDAVFTLREPTPGTGYRPVLGDNVVRVEVQPWLGRAVAVETLTWAWEGADPTGIEVALAEGCGLSPVRVVPWSDPRAPLYLAGVHAGCVEVRFRVDGECTLTALSVWTRDPDIPWPDDVGPRDSLFPTRPRSGVIEGFYGRPWTWRERSRMVRAMAGFGLGAYLYAPKDDPLHRGRWREPYPADEMDRFEAWNAEAQGLGVTVFFGISPFIDFEDEADSSALAEKARGFLARGFTGFALLADDIEFEADVQVDGSLGARHAALVNRLFEDLRADAPVLEVWFVPTVYSEERLDRWPDAPAYLQALRDLDPAVEVLWTGPRTSSATMTALDMDRFRSLVGRDPLIWDNFWANDGGDLFLGRLLLAPFSGRPPDLLGAVGGIAHNLSLQGALSRLTLGTFAAWLHDPALDDAGFVEWAIVREQAFSVGAGRIPEHDAQTLATLMAAFEGRAVDPYPRFSALEEAVSDLKTQLHAGGIPMQPVRDLLPILAGLWALPSDLSHSGLDVDVVDDAWFPAEKARAEAEVGLWTLVLLGERLAGRDGAEALARAEEARTASSRNRFLFGPGSLSDLLDEVSALSPKDRGFRAPSRGTSPAPACRVRTPATWNGWTDAVHVAVAGLPGAFMETQGRVTWTPPHAGTYEAVAVAVGTGGWDFQFVEWVCEDASP